MHELIARDKNLGVLAEDDHLALQHVIHRARDSAGTKSRLPLAGEGHPVGAEGRVIVHHDGRSGEMLRRIEGGIDVAGKDRCLEGKREAIGSGDG